MEIERERERDSLARWKIILYFMHNGEKLTGYSRRENDILCVYVICGSGGSGEGDPAAFFFIYFHRKYKKYTTIAKMVVKNGNIRYFSHREIFPHQKRAHKMLFSGKSTHGIGVIFLIYNK